MRQSVCRLVLGFGLAVFIWLGGAPLAGAGDINKDLLAAAEKGDLTAIQALLAKGADVNTKDGHGNTPLMVVAVLNGHNGIVKALLAKGANINIKNELGQTALYLAARSGYIEMVEMLAVKGADLNAQDMDGKTPLMTALAQNKTESVKTLLAKGAKINAQDSQGFTALMEAVLEGKPEMVKLLLAKGADVNVKSSDGSTALGMAAEMQKADIVKLLKEAGAKEATSAAAPPAPPVTRPKTNLLEIPNGTLIISVSSIYNETWSALNLVDGSTEYGWCSAEKAAFPHTIVFELAQPHAITGVGVDNTGDQGNSYPGISSKGIIVYGSNKSATEGFTQLTSFEAQASSRKEVTLKTPVTVQWLKFVVNSNWGNAGYTEIMELEAYGQPVGPAPKVDVTGIYQTNYGALRVDQDGTKILGCYDHAEGELSGNLNGRVMQFEWRQEKGKRSGPAIMVLSMKGDALNGFWYENGQLQGEWSGKRGGNPPQCKTAKSGGIAEKLASSGKVELYGIYFDSDSATLKPESEKTLNEILAVLQAQSALKLLIAGHTDSTNTDAYNLKLSQQRAEAVVAWLVKHGVVASRLTAKGFGKSQPVADNATAAGRALNRRVELIKQ